MGAASAATGLRNVFSLETTLAILSFLDDSSLVSTYGADASDIANLDELHCPFCRREDCPLFAVQNNVQIQRGLYYGSLGYPNRL